MNSVRTESKKSFSEWLFFMKSPVFSIIILLVVCQNACSKDITPGGMADLLLCQAQFNQVRGEDGKEHPVPGAAKLI
ncbi:MAG: hypothetical protein JRJ00_14830, partial [Deltaproteobacteria bacterium]|nr:hypothetical protein [Deltaproteobacteria bacterium]